MNGLGDGTMSDGRTHSQIAITVANVTATYLLYQADPNYAAFQCGLILGTFITPDLDHTAKTYEETRLFKFNPLLGKFWFSLSNIYAKIFIHRGVSHWPLIGTLSRLPFGLLFLLPFLLLLRYIEIEITGKMFLFVFVGWAIQDSIHFATDIIYSTKKVMLKKFKPFS